MNATEGRNKHRQLHNEGQPQMVSAEQKEYAEACACPRIVENTNDNAIFQTDRLLEKILDINNMNRALKRVRRNKGACGVDGMSTGDDLTAYIRKCQGELFRQLKEGKYRPNPVRRVEIPKEEPGKMRKLGIPTVMDRVIQQAISQRLMLIYEPQFSDNSFGFRPKRGAHDALRRCKEHVDGGYVYVVDMDLEKFFDNVCQSKLIEILSRTIKDGRVISLIHKYLNAGVVENGLFARTGRGVPQGGPLSPLLSNVMLNELDKELERRGHKFVRYADDCMILCKSIKSAERTLESITRFIETKLFLKVNCEKTKAAHIKEVKYLGYAFYRHKEECRFRAHPKAVAKMKQRIRELTSRSNGWGNEYRAGKLTKYARGWINYFKLADMKQLMRQTDEWLRRRIRAIYWKQWKRIRTRYKRLRSLGLPEWVVHEMANCRKGIWRSSMMLNRALTNKTIASLGYPSMTDYYLKAIA